MAQTNSSILRGYFDEVINQKRPDLLGKYFSEKFITHGTPYVGLGIMADNTSGVKLTVQSTIPGSPAESKLVAGDEILRVADRDRTWITFNELRESLWGLGAEGTTITMWVLRGNVEHEISLTRGLIQSYEIPFHMLEIGIPEYFKDWPDLETRLVKVMEIDDMVAYHAENQGTNVRYGRSAVWAEFGFVRVQEGKITDWWSAEDALSQFKQLGYTIHEPALVKI